MLNNTSILANISTLNWNPASTQTDASDDSSSNNFNFNTQSSNTQANNTPSVSSLISQLLQMILQQLGGEDSSSETGNGDTNANANPNPSPNPNPNPAQEQSVSIEIPASTGDSNTVQYRNNEGEWQTLDPQNTPDQVLTPDDVRIYNETQDSTVLGNSEGADITRNEDGSVIMAFEDRFESGAPNDQDYNDVIVTLGAAETSQPEK